MQKNVFLTLFNETITTRYTRTVYLVLSFLHCSEPTRFSRRSKHSHSNTISNSLQSLLFQIGQIGGRPQESKGSIIRVLPRQTLSTTQWGMKIKQVSGKTVRFTVMASAKAIIGQYEVFVETIMKDADGNKLVLGYKDDDKVCVLFNAWCKG